jgi:hypothetical protein
MPAQALAWCRETANQKVKRALGLTPEGAYVAEKPHLAAAALGAVEASAGGRPAAGTARVRARALDRLDHVARLRYDGVDGETR